MRIRKLKHGRRKFGEVVVEQEDLIDLRATIRDLVEGNLVDGEIENGEVGAWEGEGNVYCVIEIRDEEVEIPDQQFLWKALQIL